MVAVLRSAFLARRLKLIEPLAAAGRVTQEEVDALRAEMGRESAAMSAARERVDILKEAIAQLTGAAEAVPTALDVAQDFAELLGSGKDDGRFIGLTQPTNVRDPKAVRQKMREHFDLSGLAIVEFWLADEDACAVTSVLQPVGEGGRPGAFGIGLRKYGDRWLVRDIDGLPTDQHRQRFVQGFRDAKPSARQVK